MIVKKSHKLKSRGFCNQARVIARSRRSRTGLDRAHTNATIVECKLVHGWDCGVSVKFELRCRGAEVFLCGIIVEDGGIRVGRGGENREEVGGEVERRMWRD